MIVFRITRLNIEDWRNSNYGVGLFTHVNGSFNRYLSVNNHRCEELI